MFVNYVYYWFVKILVRGFLVVLGRIKNIYFIFRKEGKLRKSYFVCNL